MTLRKRACKVCNADISGLCGSFKTCSEECSKALKRTSAREQKRRYYAVNPDKRREKERRQQQRNPERFRQKAQRQQQSRRAAIIAAIPQRACCVCQVEFHPSRKNAVVCSEVCRRAQRVRHIEMSWANCVICKALFVKKYNAITCSDSCRERRHQERLCQRRQAIVSFELQELARTLARQRYYQHREARLEQRRRKRAEISAAVAVFKQMEA